MNPRHAETGDDLFWVRLDSRRRALDVRQRSTSLETRREIVPSAVRDGAVTLTALSPRILLQSGLSVPVSENLPKTFQRT